MQQRYYFLSFMLGALLLTGCGKPSEIDVEACNQLAEVLELDEMQQQECLHNKELRMSLLEMQNRKLARQLTSEYNSTKTNLEVVSARKAYFKKLQGVDSLIQVHDDFNEAIKHRGRKYAVPGWIGLATITDPKADPFVYLYDAQKKDADGLPLWRLAHLHDLNQEQKAFLTEHCMEDGKTKSEGFCEGLLYVTVKPQPGSKTLLTFELTGAEFVALELERVTEYYLQR
jgi:hypothetical protein